MNDSDLSLLSFTFIFSLRDYMDGIANFATVITPDIVEKSIKTVNNQN